MQNLELYIGLIDSDEGDGEVKCFFCENVRGIQAWIMQRAVWRVSYECRKVAISLFLSLTANRTTISFSFMES